MKGQGLAVAIKIDTVQPDINTNKFHRVRLNEDCLRHLTINWFWNGNSFAQEYLNDARMVEIMKIWISINT